MIINDLTGGKAVADYTLSGGVLTVAGHDIDIEAESGDNPVSIDISCTGGTVHRGVGARYLASVLLPARRYQESTVGEDTAMTPLPIDAAEIELRLYEVMQ